MTTHEIASRLYELCQQSQSETAHNELYADNATSTEKNMEGVLEIKRGLEAIREKGKMFQSTVEEVHSSYTNEPTIFGNNIFIEMGMDATMKGMGRIEMKEMCAYEIKDGKIISERFYY